MADDAADGAGYLANLRVGGCLHRVPVGMMELPRSKRRTCCGWRFGQAVSLAAPQVRVDPGKRCRKCFGSMDGRSNASEEKSEGGEEPIEQFDRAIWGNN